MNSDYVYFEDINQGLLRLWGARRGLDVLDVGCGYATTAAKIQALGNRVTGIEADPGAVAVARTRLERVLQADLQDPQAVSEVLNGEQFDVLIFADVLEHLAWPGATLASYLARLRPGGKVLVSLPNVGLWNVRFGLLFGRWNYVHTGVLDRTHLRFFTLGSARALLSENGLEVVASTLNPGLVRPFIPLVKRLLSTPSGGNQMDPQAILNSPVYRHYLRWIHPVERVIAGIWPGGLAFQTILEGRQVAAETGNPC
jgi:SAM-dependent methyltransferase